MSSEQKRYKIFIHDRAAQMLYKHIRFVSNVSIPAAHKLRAELYSAIASLEVMPARCPGYHTRKTSNHYRQMIVGRYQIIFAINERASIVEVKYILDSRQENDF